MQHTDRDEAPELLVVKDMSVDYEAENGVVHAVDHVSFTLHQGEILGVAGESGSGKSTLVYAIARLLRPPAVITGGAALYYPRRQATPSPEGQTDSDQKHGPAPIDLLKLSGEELRTLRWNELAIVFQSAMNALNPVMTIGDQITDVLRTHRPTLGTARHRQRVQELLQMVGISEDRQESYPHELSGGMRQRAVIAIAMALQPELVILDEPTTALDVVMQREILSEILRLKAQLGFSVIFITHDLSLLLELADQVTIMYAGRLIERASRREMYRHPRHPYSYGLLHSFPSLLGPRRKMLGIPGSPPDLRAIPDGCPFHPRCPLAFTPCSTVVPALTPPSTTEGTEQHEQLVQQVLVACHLYNSSYRAAPPSQAEIGEAYDALAEQEEEEQ